MCFALKLHIQQSVTIIGGKCMIEKNKGNLKSYKSKVWMEETLIKLMDKEEYGEITIQEITDYSGLSRRTFYRNYSSKDEIIKGHFAKIWSEYEEAVRSQSDLSMPNIAKMLIEVMTGHIGFLRLISRHHLLPLILAETDELLPLTFKDVKGKTIPFNQESINYALAFGTGGFMRLLVKWLDEDCLKSPEEIANVAKDILKILNYPNITGNVD